MEERLTIKEAGASLSLEEQGSLLCPFCQKGQMAISRKPAGIVYFCYRVSCVEGNKGGLVGDSLTRANSKPKAKVFEPKICLDPMIRVPMDIYKTMVEPYYISEDEMKRQEFKWLPYKDRLYMPVFNGNGYTIGGVAKTPYKGLKPKTLLYRHNDVPMLHYPKGQLDEDVPLILVEDIISSVRLVTAGYRSAALLGTHISPAMLSHLVKEEPRVILMLDGDASAKAVSMKLKYAGLFKNFDVVVLSNRDGSDDPKDLTDKILEEILCSVN